MHRIAIGDPQCVCHELFAQLRIRMVDGESVWQQFYPHASGSLGSSGCGHCRCLVEVWNCVHVDISLQRIGSARGSATREAIVRRSEPLQLQLWVRILPAIAPKRPLSGRAMGVLQIARWWNRRNFDLFAVAVTAPQLTASPALDANRLLRLTGLFPTRPLQINFDLVFEVVNGRWCLDGISVATPEAPPQAEAAQQPANPPAPVTKKPAPKPQ